MPDKEEEKKWKEIDIRASVVSSGQQQTETPLPQTEDPDKITDESFNALLAEAKDFQLSPEQEQERNRFIDLLIPQTDRENYRERAVQIISFFFIVGISLEEVASYFLLRRDPNGSPIYLEGATIANLLCVGTYILSRRGHAELGGKVLIAGLALADVGIHFTSIDPHVFPVVVTFIAGLSETVIEPPQFAWALMIFLVLVSGLFMQMETGEKLSIMLQGAFGAAAAILMINAVSEAHKRIRASDSKKSKRLEKALVYAAEKKDQAEKNEQEAEEAARAKTRFLANVSHEFRTPLNANINELELLLMGVIDGVPNLTPQQRLAIIKSISGGKLLANEIADNLNLAEIESGKININIVPTNIKEIVDGRIMTLQSIAEAKGLKLEAVYETQLPEAVMSDGRLLQNILNNLIGNSCKYTSDGGVTVRVGAIEDNWYIAVQDTGRGMTEDVMHELFQPFFRAKESETTQGTGIGLYNTAEFVKALGGKIDVTSEVDNGSTFTLSFPIQLPPPESPGSAGGPKKRRAQIIS